MVVAIMALSRISCYDLINFHVVYMINCYAVYNLKIAVLVKFNNPRLISVVKMNTLYYFNDAWL